MFSFATSTPYSKEQLSPSDVVFDLWIYQRVELGRGKTALTPSDQMTNRDPLSPGAPCMQNLKLPLSIPFGSALFWGGGGQRSLVAEHDLRCSHLRLLSLRTCSV